MKSTIFFIFFLFFTVAVFPQSHEVFINELLASNSSVNIDPDFNLNSDWLELFNPQYDTVNLSKWFLTDDTNNPTKWQIPDGTSIPPGDFLIFWADGKNIKSKDYHTNFQLSKSGEEIALSDSNQVLIDRIVFDNQITDISFGRQPDGGPDLYFFGVPTPGETNITSIFLKTETPQFSLKSGFYTEDQILEISTNDSLATIRYTINGDEPTISSPVYSTSILLNSRAGEPNVFSEIRTNRDPFLWLPEWIPPAGEVFKANVIRARAFKNGFHPSDIITRTYFVDKNINERYSTLPVISIVSDYQHLFDDHTGIYVPGVNHRPGDSGSGNYFQDWEKPAHIEFFEPGGELGFSQDVGIRIQGGTSPASPQKGLHVIARSEYGKNRISYPLFKNDPSKAKNLTEFKRFIIRAWGSLITGSLFNDAYAHRIMAKNDLDIQAYQPAVVFINGEYWGLHELREANKNSWYYQYHYDIDRENPGYDILIHSFRFGQPYPYVDEGDSDHWNELINYLNTHDMNLQANYEYIKTQIDVDNFITYLGHCIYVGKWDWPNNNDASWRPRTANGKWRWIQYDMETGFGVATGLGPQYAMLGPQLNMLKAAIAGINIPDFGKYGPHPILAKLHTNESFKKAFIDWFEYHLNFEFIPDSMNYILEKMEAEIRPYMQEYKHRWPFIGDVDFAWANSLEQIREFNNYRPEYMRSHLLDYENGKITSVEKNKVSADYKLQISPNPFNTLTNIMYSIPKPGNVLIGIYDVHGQMITSFDEKHNSGGNYTIEWNAKDFSNGLYFLSIYVDDFYNVKKIILVR